MTRLKITNCLDSINKPGDNPWEVIYENKPGKKKYYLLIQDDNVDELLSYTEDIRVPIIDMAVIGDNLMYVTDIEILNGELSLYYKGYRYSFSVGDDHPMEVINNFLLSLNLPDRLRKVGL